MSDKFDERALYYHRHPVPGKLAIAATKPLATQQDLALAYSPGVAAACRAIAASPGESGDYTVRSNLVAVVTNGTAVLGLGDIGPLAAKPVMEGKAVLFKKFSGIDVFDIEVDESDVDKLVEIIASLEPTFGGINLEDIKAPECFELEHRLRERMNIPVFHDDQHGTAIIVGAAVLNALRLVGKGFDDIKVVTSGAGAAALACLDQLVSMGVRRENIVATDISGVVYKGRAENMDPWKARYAVDTDARRLADVIEGADVFLGLSVPGVLTPELAKRMADKPVILALANPVPEIIPEEAKAARPDAIIATGRSDYPNQVNNVLCFPFIFRGALDVVATDINEEMKLACVRAIADLALAETSELVSKAYGADLAPFGPENLIPKPFDPRLITMIAPAVARAAMDSGVATRPIEDFELYRQRLTGFVFRSGLVMKPIFEAAKRKRVRLVYAEGEERRVLQAAQQVIDDGIAFPILVGRPNVIDMRIKQLGLRMRAGEEFELVNILKDKRFRDYWSARRPKGNIARGSQDGGALAEHRRRGAHGAPRRGGCHAVRHGGAVYRSSPARGEHHRSRSGNSGILHDVRAHSSERYLLHLRHARHARTERRGGGGDDDARGGRGTRIRDYAEGRSFVALELRHGRSAVVAKDARSGSHPGQGGARAGGRRRDARRRRPVRGAPTRHTSRLAPQGPGEPARNAERRRREHCLQSVEDPRRRSIHRSDVDRLGKARAYRHPFDDGSGTGQHERARERARPGGEHG